MTLFFCCPFFITDNPRGKRKIEAKFSRRDNVTEHWNMVWSKHCKQEQKACLGPTGVSWCSWSILARSRWKKKVETVYWCLQDSDWRNNRSIQLAWTWFPVAGGAALEGVGGWKHPRTRNPKFKGTNPWCIIREPNLEIWSVTLYLHVYELFRYRHIKKRHCLNNVDYFWRT